MNVRHHLPESCGELIEKHAGNTRLHTGEFTSELVDRIAQNMDYQFVLSLLEKCISSISNSNRYVRGQTATIIGKLSIIFNRVFIMMNLGSIMKSFPKKSDLSVQANAIMPLLIRMLKDESPDNRAKAAEALSFLHSIS